MKKKKLSLFVACGIIAVKGHCLSNTEVYRHTYKSMHIRSDYIGTQTIIFYYQSGTAENFSKWGRGGLTSVLKWWGGRGAEETLLSVIKSLFFRKNSGGLIRGC